MLSLRYVPSLNRCGSPSLSSLRPYSFITGSTNFCPTTHTSIFLRCNEHENEKGNRYLLRGYRSFSFAEEEEESGDLSGVDNLSRFEEAVKLFNAKDYYACHDLLESLWYESNDPLRTLLHAILQCAVAFYHLFNQGAMMEMGEGVCRLRKLNFAEGPFDEFEQEISPVLNFIYQTQLELAACEFPLAIVLFFLAGDLPTLYNNPNSMSFRTSKYLAEELLYHYAGL